MPDQAPPLSPARGATPSLRVDYTTLAVAQLIEGCAGGEAAAWQEFMRRFNRIIAITASRVARRRGDASPQTIDDLIQDTYLKLCAGRGRVLREFQFENEDAIYSFLKVITANVVNDHFKGLHADKRGGNRANEPLDGSEEKSCRHDAAGLTPPERALLVDQIDACLRAIVPVETNDRDRTIFWLYYREGLTAKEITSLPFVGLSVKGVESTLHRLIQLVRSHLVAPRAQNTNAR
jgi:RNA polymerase sigma-70 factor, ECF subfamily